MMIVIKTMYRAMENRVTMTSVQKILGARNQPKMDAREAVAMMERHLKKSYFEWFQDLERKEKIAVVAGSIAILNESGDTISDVINVADDIVSAESQSDSTTESISISDESELSPADQYPNPDYATPKEGTTEWHIPMNNNFEEIEENIEFLSEEVVALGEMTEKNAQLMEDYVGALIGRIEQLDERVETLEGEIDNPED